MFLPPHQTVIECDGFGDAEVLRMASRPLPHCGDHQVLIKIHAAGINRADILQRRGKYPPPVGASDILGLEVSGEVVQVGATTHRWRVGDHACALLEGGGYAEYVAVAATQCLPKPDGMSWVEAATMPEALFTITAHLLSGVAQAKAGETVLIHGGSSGIGSFAIQILRLLGMQVIVTVGSAAKADFCQKLGADHVIQYQQDDFVEAVRDATTGQGVDVVWDMIGGDYVGRNLSLLRDGGRHISLATQQSSKTEIDLRHVMQKRLILTGTTVRARTAQDKAQLAAFIEERLYPWVRDGRVKSLVYKVLPLNNVVEAHKMMEKSEHMGKIGLEVVG